MLRIADSIYCPAHFELCFLCAWSATDETLQIGRESQKELERRREGVSRPALLALSPVRYQPRLACEYVAGCRSLRGLIRWLQTAFTTNRQTTELERELFELFIKRFANVCLLHLL